MHPVSIIETQDLRVAVLEHRGDPTLIGDSIRRFIAWRKQIGLSPRISATFNILYNNPTATAPDDFRLDLCAATERKVLANPDGIIAKIIPGGRCAVLRHVGSDTGIAGALAYLCGEWLPRSGQRRRDFPLYCQRVSFFPQVPHQAAITDLFLPLQ